MKRCDFIRRHIHIFLQAAKFGVTVHDAEMLSIYDEYFTMLQNGEQKKYITAYLSGKHNISESNVRRIVRKLDSRAMP
jgi:hypothetical protein